MVTSMRPKWTQKLLTETEVSKIEAAIHQAEKLTSGEIVPIIAQKSIQTGHVPYFIFLILALICVTIDFGLPSWGVYIELALSYFLSGFLSRFSFLQRLLTPDTDQMAQVTQRARAEFFESGLHQTQGATGILIFISLLEHQVIVLADEAIDQKVPAHTWEEVVKIILDGKKQNSLSEGIIRGIERCSEILKPHFPLPETDLNELENKLIFLE